MDGPVVAVKVFPPYHDPGFLAAANAIRARLVASGSPAPPALSPVVPLARGWVWIEDWLAAPSAAPAVDVVSPLAAGLADLIDRCRHLQRDPALRRSWQSFDPPVGIWRNPPRAEVNLEANPEGSEWILDVAVAARKTVQHAPGPSLIGYVDWRPDNVRLTPPGELAAVYDWDSIQLTGRVHLLAGACGGLTPEAMAAILSTFEQVTGETLNRNQRLAVAGRVVWSRAMWARYEHARRLPAAEQRFASHLRDDAIALSQSRHRGIDTVGTSASHPPRRYTAMSQNV